jgi:hypothetical protein
LANPLEQKNNNKNKKVEFLEKKIQYKQLDNQKKSINKELHIVNNSKEKMKNNFNKKNYFVKNKKLPLKSDMNEYLKFKYDRNINNLKRKTKSRDDRSNRKQLKALGEKKYKKNLIKKTYMDISPRVKADNKNKYFIRKKFNYSNLNNNKLNSKKNFDNSHVVKKNLLINDISKLNNNTLDNENYSNKIKLYFNFQKLNFLSIKDSKGTRSTDKKNLKRNSLENSNKKKNKKLINFLNTNSYIKKDKPKINIDNMSNFKKYNNCQIKLKKKLKEKNIHLNYTNLKSNYDIEDSASINNNLNKENILKTEKMNDGEKYQKKLKNLLKPNISINNKNILIKDKNIIISNINDIINNSTNKKIKNYNTDLSSFIKKTEIKKSIKNKDNKEYKINFDKYNIKTLDEMKNLYLLKNDQIRYNDITEKIKQYFSSNNHKKTIDATQNKYHKIKIKIDNGSKGPKSNNNNNKSIASTQYYKMNKTNSIKMDNKMNLNDSNINNINIMNKRKTLKEIHISINNSKINNINSYDKKRNSTDHNKDISEKKKIYLNTIDNGGNGDLKERNNIIHIKLNSINETKLIDYKTKRNILKNKTVKKDISKQKNNYNKAINNSNMNNSIKNPFINESKFDASINNNYNINNNQRKYVSNKRIKKNLNNKKKKKQ